MALRAGSDYGEKVHWSRILGEWSNMIGYGMGSSLTGVSQVFILQWKNALVIGEWSNMIGYGMGSSLTRVSQVYTTVKKCIGQEFQENEGIWLATEWVLHWPAFRRFILRWKSALVKNSRRMKQYDWLRNGFFTDRRFAGLDYGEKVHWSRILGEWSNMIGYKMGSSLTGVCAMAKTSPVENFKHRWRNVMVVHMATFFAKGVLQWSIFFSILKPSDKKFGLQSISTWSIFI
jgi:hypothetical protein